MSWASSKSRQEERGTPWLPDVGLRRERLVGRISFLNNKCVSNELSASPQGVSLFCLTFALAAFIPRLRTYSPALPRESHRRWILQLQKQDPPWIYACTLQQPPVCFFINMAPKRPHHLVSLLNDDSLRCLTLFSSCYLSYQDHTVRSWATIQGSAILKQINANQDHS